MDFDDKLYEPDSRTTNRPRVKVKTIREVEIDGLCFQDFGIGQMESIREASCVINLSVSSEHHSGYIRVETPSNHVFYMNLEQLREALQEF